MKIINILVFKFMWQNQRQEGIKVWITISLQWWQISHILWWQVLKHPVCHWMYVNLVFSMNRFQDNISNLSLNRVTVPWKPPLHKEMLSHYADTWNLGMSISLLHALKKYFNPTFVNTNSQIPHEKRCSSKFMTWFRNQIQLFASV